MCLRRGMRFMMAEIRWGTDVNLDTVKKGLLARKEELLERHGRIVRKTRHRDEPLPQDFAEQAVELENQEVLEALDFEVADELRSIEHALIRVDAGDYPYCSTCGEEIPAARLKALPTTSLCVDCATEAERR